MKKSEKELNTEKQSSGTVVTTHTQTQPIIASVCKENPTVLTTEASNPIINKSFTNSTKNLNSNILNPIPTETVTQNVVKKPIQSVRPLSTTSAVPTKVKPVNTTPIILSKPNTSSKTSSLEKHMNFSISSANFYSSLKSTKNVTNTTTDKNTQILPKSIDNPDKSRFEMSQNISSHLNCDQIKNNSIEHNSPNLGPKIRNYSKIRLKNSKPNDSIVETNVVPKVGSNVEPNVGPNVEPNVGPNVEQNMDPMAETVAESNEEKPKVPTLCAKIISSEDALAALSAIPNTKPLIENSKSCEITDNIVNESNESNDSFGEIQVMNDSIQQKSSDDSKAISETSFSNQFKIFLNNLKTSALQKKNVVPNIKSQQQKSSSKEIVEITID